MLFLILQEKNWLQARFNEIMYQGNMRKLPRYEELELTKIGEVKIFSNEEINHWLEMIWERGQNDYPESIKKSLYSVIIYWESSYRSVDIGDIIQLEDHRIFQVESSGFSQVFQPPIVHISQTLNDSQLVAHFPSLGRNWMIDSVTERLTFPGNNSNIYYLETCKREQIKYQRLR